MLHLAPIPPASLAASADLSRTSLPAAETTLADPAPTQPSADEGPLALLPASPETDPALQARATIFFTVDGLALASQIDGLKTFPELTSAAALHSHIASAADALAALPGRGVLLLSGGHHAPSSLMQFHAAVDICRKHGWPLLMELEKDSFDRLQTLETFLEAEPRLKRLLGKNTLQSRAGQQIAWNYVRTSGDRGALQKFLPELLGRIDMQRAGVRCVHVDTVGPHGGDDSQREAAMVHNTHRALKKEGKGVLVLGLVHAMPMHRSFQARDVACREIAVLDESANHAHRHYDDAEEGNPAYHTAAGLAHNIRLPEFDLAARQTVTWRMPPELSPFG